MNSGKGIVVLGGGGHARSIISILRNLKEFSVLGYTDRMDHGPVLGVPYLGADDVIVEMGPEIELVLGISYLVTPNDQSCRSELIQRFRAGRQFPPIVAASALVDPIAEIGLGAMVMNRAVVNTGAKIGEFCIVNTAAIVEHGCVIGNEVNISPGSVICGDTVVGSNCFIGAGAIVQDGISIVPNCVVGSAANVVSSITRPGMYLGNPARLVRKRGAGDSQLGT